MGQDISHILKPGFARYFRKIAGILGLRVAWYLRGVVPLESSMRDPLVVGILFAAILPTVAVGQIDYFGQSRHVVAYAEGFVGGGRFSASATDYGVFDREVSSDSDVSGASARQNSSLEPTGISMSLLADASNFNNFRADSTSSFSASFRVSTPVAYRLTGISQSTDYPSLVLYDGNNEIIFRFLYWEPVFDFSGIFLPGSYRLDASAIATATYAAPQGSRSMLTATLTVPSAPAFVAFLAAGALLGGRTRRRG